MPHLHHEKGKKEEVERRTDMNPVSTSPAMKASSAASRDKNSRFVDGPTI